MKCIEINLKRISLQSTDHVCQMARTLEKLFLEKLKSMPANEVEIEPLTKGRKPKTKAVRSLSQNRTSDLGLNGTVSSSNKPLQKDPVQLKQPRLRQTSTNNQTTTKLPTSTNQPVEQINNSHRQVRC